MKNTLMKSTQTMMNTPWHDSMPEHEVLYVALLAYGISLKIISNILVDYANLSLWIPSNPMVCSPLDVFCVVSQNLLTKCLI